MKKIIKQQLEKVKNVELDFDENTTFIKIKKLDKIQMKLGRAYGIEILDSFLQDSNPTSSISNWNNERRPQEKYYFAEPVQYLGNMVKINATGRDNGTPFNGWLPLSAIKVYGEVK